MKKIISILWMMSLVSGALIGSLITDTSQAQHLGLTTNEATDIKSYNATLWGEIDWDLVEYEYEITEDDATVYFNVWPEGDEEAYRHYAAYKIGDDYTATATELEAYTDYEYRIEISHRERDDVWVGERSPSDAHISWFDGYTGEQSDRIQQESTDGRVYPTDVFGGGDSVYLYHSRHASQHYRYISHVEKSGAAGVDVIWHTDLDSYHTAQFWTGTDRVFSRDFFNDKDEIRTYHYMSGAADSKYTLDYEYLLLSQAPEPVYGSSPAAFIYTYEDGATNSVRRVETYDYENYTEEDIFNGMDFFGENIEILDVAFVPKSAASEDMMFIAVETKTFNNYWILCLSYETGEVYWGVYAGTAADNDEPDIGYANADGYVVVDNDRYQSIQILDPTGSVEGTLHEIEDMGSHSLDRDANYYHAFVGPSGEGEPMTVAKYSSTGAKIWETETIANRPDDGSARAPVMDNYDNVYWHYHRSPSSGPYKYVTMIDGTAGEILWHESGENNVNEINTYYDWSAESGLTVKYGNTKSFTTEPATVVIDIIEVLPFEDKVYIRLEILNSAASYESYTKLEFKIATSTGWASARDTNEEREWVELGDGVHEFMLTEFQTVPEPPEGAWTSFSTNTTYAWRWKLTTLKEPPDVGPPETEITYGDTRGFTTLAEGDPDIVTLEPADVTENNATFRAQVVAQGQNLSAQFSYYDNATMKEMWVGSESFDESGIFEYTVTDLLANHDYTVWGRGEYTNSSGDDVTITGNEIYFSTTATIPEYYLDVIETDETNIVLRHTVIPNSHQTWLTLNINGEWISKWGSYDEETVFYHVIDNITDDNDIIVEGWLYYNHTDVPDSDTDEFIYQGISESPAGADAGWNYPTIETGSARDITKDTATLRAKYETGNASEIEITFRYKSDVTEDVGDIIAWNETDWGTETASSGNYTELITDLEYLTTHNYQSKMKWDKNDNGTFWYKYGGEKDFDTAWEDPEAFTLLAANVNDTQAQLMGLATWGTADYDDTRAYFEYAPYDEPGWDNTTSYTPQEVSWVPFWINATDLLDETIYKFRAVIDYNVSGTPETLYGQWLNFTTDGHSLPEITDNSAENITWYGADLSANYDTAVDLDIYMYFLYYDNNFTTTAERVTGTGTYEYPARNLDELTQYHHFGIGEYERTVDTNTTVFYTCYNTTYPLNFTTLAQPPDTVVGTEDLGISSTYLTVTVDLLSHDYMNMKYNISYGGDITHTSDWINITASDTYYYIVTQLKSDTEYDVSLETNTTGMDNVTHSFVTKTLAHDAISPPDPLTAFTAGLGTTHQGAINPGFDAGMRIKYLHRLKTDDNYTESGKFGLTSSPTNYLVEDLNYSSTYVYYVYLENTYINSTGIETVEYSNSSTVQFTTPEPQPPEADMNLTNYDESGGKIRVLAEVDYDTGEFDTVKYYIYIWERDEEYYPLRIGPHTDDESGVWYTYINDLEPATWYSAKVQMKAWTSDNTTGSPDWEGFSDTIDHRTWGEPAVSVDDISYVTHNRATVDFIVELAYEFGSEHEATVTLKSGSVVIQTDYVNITDEYQTFDIKYTDLEADTEYTVEIECEGMSDSDTFTTLKNVGELLGDTFLTGAGVMLAIALIITLVVAYFTQSGVVACITFLSVIVVGALAGYIAWFYVVFTVLLTVMYVMYSWRDES